MDTFTLILIIVPSFALFVWLMIFLVKRFFNSSTGDLSNLSVKMLTQLNEVTNQVNSRLRENSEMTHRQGQDLNVRLDGNQKAIREVTNKLSVLEESSKRIFEVGKDISSLQDILKAPKLRGGLGEYLLGDILEQILPRNNFVLQYAFKSGEKVDAVIKLKNMIIPVDSKFPLENFTLILSAKDQEAKMKAKKQFVRDVKKHIDAIAQKYILPQEGTSDFALMYITAENVYYEIILNEKDIDSITNYALAKKIIPVSPNSFYAYLQAILIGLKGLQVEKGAKDILAGLSRLKIEFEKFGGDFSLLGKHLNNSRSAYESSQKKLDKLGEGLESIESPIKAKKLK